ncbi:MAG: signal peptidase I [Candidatus Saccharibacteria bacterium]|nr:signal peptidase I [Candidatus Saccharibacteria bacterium]
MENKVNFFQKHPIMKDLMSLVWFVICVIVGTMLLNAFVFRTYNVVGVSMENTLHGEDRIVVNRIPVTVAHFFGREYTPERGQVVVFANGSATGPLTCEAESGVRDQYIIKRVIAFPGERVLVKDGELKVYNEAHPEGFKPDESTRKSNEDGPKLHTAGEVDTVVPEGEIFVSGDNREGSHSYDSRNGLGTVPYCRIIGPVLLRMYPFDKIRLF